jgi:hypothetical protein
VTEVNGVGHIEFADALESRGLMNNLKTTLLVVDENHVKNIVFDNEHSLGIASTAVDFDWENGGTASILCATNHPSGWQMDTNYGGSTGIEYTGTATGGWLTAVKNGNNIELAVKLNTTMEERTAKVHIRAGNLAGVINVTLEEWLPYVGRFGGKLKQNADGEWQYEHRLYIQGVDESTGVVWSTNTATQGGTNENGKTSTWVLYSNNATYNNQAAMVCMNKNGTVTSETDPNYRWYLPAHNQLKATWISYNSYGAAYRPSPTYYWSATEHSAATASWAYTFNGGTSSGNVKSSSNLVRCVRELAP